MLHVDRYILIEIVKYLIVLSFKYVNKAILEEYKRRVFEAVIRNEELENIQPKIGKIYAKLLY